MTSAGRPTLRTERLVLRPFDRADAPAVQALAGAREVADTTLLIPHPYPDGVAEAWIESHEEAFRARRAIDFAIVLASTGELIGAIGLVVTSEHEHAELGYWVGVPFWNRGYCSEAAGEVVRYALDEAGLSRVFARPFSRNPASAQVLRKIGMAHEGTLRKHVLKWGVLEDMEVYGRLRPGLG